MLNALNYNPIKASGEVFPKVNKDIASSTATISAFILTKGKNESINSTTKGISSSIKV